MSNSVHRGPVGVESIGDFDAVIDARSPAEYQLDHLPGALSHPVLNDEERAIVGTLYKQQGAFEARRVGAGMVAANLARHWQQSFADKPASWRPLVYCWRGGQRSGSMVTWMRMTGWDAQQLRGGYKAFRRHVVEQLPALIAGLRLVVLCGQTGTAKTRILQALAAQGAQVLDLEGMARHKGSLLGAWPGQPQPSQKQFETTLYTALQRFDLARPVFVESESARIGLISLPLEMVAHLRASAELVEIVADPAVRLAFLLRDYAYLGDDPAALQTLMGKFVPLQGHETVRRWQGWAAERNLPALFAELMARHYDPQYQRSLGRNFGHWSGRQRFQADDLSDAGIAALAGRVAEKFAD
ncbi:MAG: tRNA 2-selenouridine(34) synthase MnmH [Lautropia sp.]|nr:tRNA 2-selenouridine(34) synthase MnmH [Lautropia sp.]